MTFPANSAVVELNQRLSHIAMEWLEPLAPDSAMAWNAFDPIFEQREYGEAHNIPFKATQGGKESLYPEYQLKIGEFVREEAAEKEAAKATAAKKPVAKK